MLHLRVPPHVPPIDLRTVLCSLFSADKGKHKDEKPQMYVLVTAAERTVAGSPTGLNINGQDSVYGNGHHHERGFTLFAAASATVVPSDSQDFTLSDKK